MKQASFSTLLSKRLVLALLMALVFVSQCCEETPKADSFFYINDQLFVIVSPKTDEQGVQAGQRRVNQRFKNHQDETSYPYEFEWALATFGKNNGLIYRVLIATAKKRLQIKLKSNQYACA
ncbi:hypothetical protein P8S54_10170 [Thiomicrospira sp. R3]|uniref:hypothetical protein n=1 Tax=Thiomicrospira sp. R3 TaxID=3035472 RepID=UPI00259B2FB9|nr:hypothetical protein [Thiomicrospira sp. R3]WFE68559.1 hypothetical protein P8S54_10170 [Thiomicrospira sp. R3]